MSPQAGPSLHDVFAQCGATKGVGLDGFRSASTFSVKWPSLSMSPIDIRPSRAMMSLPLLYQSTHPAHSMVVTAPVWLEITANSSEQSCDSFDRVIRIVREPFAFPDLRLDSAKSVPNTCALPFHSCVRLQPSRSSRSENIGSSPPYPHSFRITWSRTGTWLGCGLATSDSWFNRTVLFFSKKPPAIPRLTLWPKCKGGEIWWFADCSPRMRTLVVFEGTGRDFLREVNQERAIGA